MTDIQKSFQHQQSKQGLNTRHVKSVFAVFQLQKSPIIRFLGLEYTVQFKSNGKQKFTGMKETKNLIFTIVFNQDVYS